MNSMPSSVEKVTRSCDVCGVPVTRYPSQAKSQRIFCSQKCVGAAKQHGATIYCAMCDGAFYRRMGEQDGSVNQFCSRECYHSWRRENRSDQTYPRIGAAHEHRLVAAAILGRALLSSEVVHHIDKDKHNSAAENLAVFPDHPTHMRVHHGKMSDAELNGYRLVRK